MFFPHFRQEYFSQEANRRYNFEELERFANSSVHNINDTEDFTEWIRRRQAGTNLDPALYPPITV